MSRYLSVTLALTMGCGTSTSLSTAPSSGSPVGIWKGTSMCTVRPSACNDEVVVYHFAATANPEVLTLTANKIVDGQELEMGTMTCRYAVAEHHLLCPIENKKGSFSYAIDGESMHGTLDLADGTRFRNVEVKRAR